MANDIAKTSAIPSWMPRTQTPMGDNLDQSDFKPPRLKLLAGQSPEVMDGTPGATPGNFWITVLNKNLGPQVTGTPIWRRKSYQVWMPKTPGSDQKGPLATASDGLNWDVPNQVFEVRFPGNPKLYKWRIGKQVTDFGATRFGSQQDDNPKSKPIATLTYDFLWWIDLPDGGKQLCVFTSARTGVEPIKNLNSTIQAMGVDMWFQRYTAVAKKKTGPTGDPYFTFEFQFVGLIQDEAEGATTRSLADQYRKMGAIAAANDDEERPAAGPVEQPADVDEIPF
jgi:hypothetical protein